MAAVRFFGSASQFRRWLARNHAAERELTVGFHKASSGRGGLTYPRALDEALCFGWIDGVRRGIDDATYCIRFTPRKRDSIWSAVNVRHVQRLRREGRMTAAGLEAFQSRDRARSKLYSFENRPRRLPPAYRERFAANERAWKWFNAQAPWYRRTAVFWVMSAKKEDTRLRRLFRLIAASARGRRPPPFAS